MNLFLLALFLLSVTFTGMASAEQAQKKPQIMGWVERARIYPGGLPIHAKLDTGAQTSSLDAPGYELVQKDGKNWVQFTLINSAGRAQKFDLEVARSSVIKSRTGPNMKRPVVLLRVCVGGIYKVAEVNLSRRTHFNYKLLIGRSFLGDDIAVLSSAKFTTKFSCPRAK